MNGDIGSALQQAWQGILDLVSNVVSPDWGQLVKLIPLAIAPLVALFVLGAVARWLLYTVRRPRARLQYVDGPRPLIHDAHGSPLMPVGVPFSLATGLAYPPGTTRTDDGRELTVICPMCGVERSAELRTCGNCGLVLTVNRSIQVARPAGPPPGGAAIA